MLALLNKVLSATLCCAYGHVNDPQISYPACIHIHIYIYIEREREKDNNNNNDNEYPYTYTTITTSDGVAWYTADSSASCPERAAGDAAAGDALNVCVHVYVYIYI